MHYTFPIWILTICFLFWLSLLEIFYFRKIWFFYHLSATFLWSEDGDTEMTRKVCILKGFCISPLCCLLIHFGWFHHKLRVFDNFQDFLYLLFLFWILKVDSICQFLDYCGSLFMINTLSLRNKLIPLPLFECGWRFFLLIFIFLFIHLLSFEKDISFICFNTKEWKSKTRQLKKKKKSLKVFLICYQLHYKTILISQCGFS